MTRIFNLFIKRRPFRSVLNLLQIVHIRGWKAGFLRYIILFSNFPMLLGFDPGFYLPGFLRGLINPVVSGDFLTRFTPGQEIMLNDFIF